MTSPVPGVGQPEPPDDAPYIPPDPEPESPYVPPESPPEDEWTPDPLSAPRKD